MSAKILTFRDPRKRVAPPAPAVPVELPSISIDFGGARYTLAFGAATVTREPAPTDAHAEDAQARHENT